MIHVCFLGGEGKRGFGVWQGAQRSAMAAHTTDVSCAVCESHACGRQLAAAAACCAWRRSGCKLRGLNTCRDRTPSTQGVGASSCRAVYHRRIGCGGYRLAGMCSLSDVLARMLHATAARVTQLPCVCVPSLVACLAVLLLELLVVLACG
jgi:hypothetical protein